MAGVSTRGRILKVGLAGQQQRQIQPERERETKRERKAEGEKDREGKKGREKDKRVAEITLPRSFPLENHWPGPHYSCSNAGVWHINAHRAT